MKPFHIFRAIVPVFMLVTYRDVSAVGRGVPRVSVLEYDASTSSTSSSEYRGPSPAELEEQEEEEGNEEQVLDQVSSPSQMPPQPQASSQLPTAANAQRPVEGAAPMAQPETAVRSSVRDQMSKAFLSNTENAAQMEKALPEPGEAPSPASPKAGEARQPQAREAVPPARGEDFSQHAAHLDLAALSATVLSKPLPGQPQESGMVNTAFTKPFFPASVEGLPAEGSSLVSSLDANAKPKKGFQFTGKHNTCHPPCIQGRGVCNDNVCFCKTPYTGTTCQHKMSNYSRVKYPMLVAASCVCVVLGMLFAQVLHSFITRRVEKRLVWLGDGMVKQEIWMPPDNSKKKGGPK